ncbi:MAG: leucine-rich repeat protein [Ruminococcus sp.]|uniref:leucine-rich repeat protein n=1 Tax=Ruminococcus sp. TaxID=41978 RepID=UPI0025D51445|nr:leucine-rich repeat protein [Ruminococcus sp.]MCR5600848.1 leucine-rich repeat protein [Ruminococcus sp.]
MKKKFISIICAAALALTGTGCNIMIPYTSEAVYSSDSIGEYKEASNDTWEWKNFGDHVIITKYFSNQPKVTIPSSIEGLPVTALTEDVFWLKASTIEEIFIPSTVTDIDISLKYCPKLARVEIDKDNTSFITENDIIYNSNKTKLIKCLSHEAAEITVPDTVTRIEDGAFSYCSKLKKVNIPSTVKSMGNEAFINCDSLESINVDEKNLYYSTVDGVLFDYHKDILYKYPNGSKNSSYTIPNGVTLISSCAFENSFNLEAVNLPDSLEVIGIAAFENCIKLNGVVIPDSVTKIEINAFNECKSLSDITFSKNITDIHSSAMLSTPWFDKQPDGAIYIGKVLYRIKGQLPKNSTVTVKEGTVGISDYAFNTDGEDYEPCNKNVVSVVLPEGIKYIGPYALCGCVDLTEINLPDSLTKIGYCAFMDCSSLKSITLPQNLSEIESFTFYGCSSLEEIDIPQNIINVSDGCLTNCSSLRSVTFNCTYCTINEPFKQEQDHSLDEITEFTGTICGYEDSSAQKYAEENGHNFTSLGNYSSPSLFGDGELKDDDTWRWVEFKDHAVIVSCISEEEDITIPNTLNGLPVTEISTLFIFNYNTKSIKIPANITELNTCLNGIEKITDIEVDKDNKSYIVENGVLYTSDKAHLLRCSTKVSGELNIPDTVVKVDDYAFNNCSELTKIYVPASVKYFPDSIEGCSSLEAVNVAKGNEKYSSINGVLIEDNSLLKYFPPNHPDTSYIVPESIKYIGNCAFYDCDKLVSITFPDSLEMIFNSAFEKCDKLNNVMIPDSVTHIHDMAFYNCKGLRKIVFSKNLIHFGSNVLYDTPWLRYYPNGPVYCGSAFYEMRGILSDYPNVTIKDGIKCIADNAFDHNIFIESVTLPDSIVQIGSRAFSGCSSLKSVNIPKGTTLEYDSTFYGCSSLENIILAPDATTIISHEFESCNSLKNVVIPANIQSIEYNAFSLCASLESVTILNPDCDFSFNYPEIICNSISFSDDGDKVVNFSGTIYGYDDSTAEEYALKNGYKFSSLGKAYSLGDVNNDGMINSIDASSVLAYYAKNSTDQKGGYSDRQKAAADVDHDGAINSIDASKILAYYAYESTTSDNVKSIDDYLKDKK